MMGSNKKVPNMTMMITWIGLFLLLAKFHSCTHFRGGMITWTPAKHPYEINICYRIAWRRSYSPSTFCNETTILQKRLMGAHGNLTCTYGCSGVVGPLYFQCTDYSVTNDWTSGVYCYPYRFPSTTNEFAISFRSCCWIPLLKGGGNWSMLMTGDLRPRRDNGLRNRAPTSGVPPIIRFQMGCNQTYVIPVSDADNDRIRCRFATNSQECGGVCNSFVNARINERTCTIQYEPVVHVSEEGFYAVSIVIEDFAPAGGREPLSQVPLQFLAHLFYSDLPCYASPHFIDSLTPLDNTCISVPLNRTYHGQVVADSKDRAIRIQEFDTVSPSGLIKRPLRHSLGSTYVMNYEWRPTYKQRGKNTFCYMAINNAGQRSEQRCLVFYAGQSCPVDVLKNGNNVAQIEGALSVTCLNDGIEAFANVDPDWIGAMYIKNDYKLQQCRVFGIENKERPVPLKAKFDQCTFTEDTQNGIYSAIVVIQPNMKIVTDMARAYQVKCVYGKDFDDSRTVTAELDVDMIQTTTMITVGGEEAQVSMVILDEFDNLIRTAHIGQSLKLRITISPRAVYGIFAYNCLTQSNVEDWVHEIIDSAGCAIEEKIFGNFKLNRDTKALTSAFTAFKFPLSSYVKFQCEVKICVGFCEEVECANSPSFGKRKKRDTMTSAAKYLTHKRVTFVLSLD